MRHRKILLIIVMVVAFSSQPSESALSGLQVPNNTGCACPSEVLSYTCIAVGAGITVWEASGVDCTIILRHNLFDSGVAFDECSNGYNIAGKSVGVEDNCYTSQLNVTVNFGLNNRNISCIHNSGSGMNTIGTSTLTVVDAPFPPPNNVRLTEVLERSLIFSWNSLGPNCASVQFATISNCGNCPNVTSSMTVACSDVQLLSTDAFTCSFQVKSVLCGNNVGNLSAPVNAILKLPDAPNVTVIPIYSSNNGPVVRLSIIISQPVLYVIASGIPESIINYSINFNSTSGIVHSSAIKFVPSICMDDFCMDSVDVSSYCSQAEKLIVAVSAANEFGYGPTSSPVNIECLNSLIRVEFHPEASTISCIFVNQADIVSNKSCIVEYRKCSDFGILQIAGVNTTSINATIDLQLIGSSQMYCYNITGSNTTHTVIVQGIITTSASSTSQTLSPGVTVAIVLCVLLVMACIFCALLMILLLWKTYHKNAINFVRHKNESSADEGKELIPLNHPKKVAPEMLPVESQLKLRKIDLNERNFVPNKFSTEPMELNQFIEKMGLDFGADCAFCQYSSANEVLSEENEILLMSTETDEYFSPNVDRETLYEILSRGVLQSTKYTVLFRGKGSGTRLLQKDTFVLFERPVQGMKQPRVRVDEKNFYMRTFPANSTLNKFCMKHKIDIQCVFLELDEVDVIDSILCVMLLDKRTNQLFTGGCALQEVKKHFSKTEPLDQTNWRIFICCDFGSHFGLMKNVVALYQVDSSQFPIENLPTLPIDFYQFVMSVPDVACTVKMFRNKHDFEGDVWVEASRFNLEKLEDTSILDTILVDRNIEESLDLQLHYVCVSWDKVKKLTAQKKWRIFVLKDIKDDFMLWIDTVVLYRAKRTSQQVNMLTPVISDLFCEMKLKKDDTLTRFCEAQTGVVFVELADHKSEQNLSIVDVILLDKASPTLSLYSGPFALQMVKVKQQFDCNKWKVFVLSGLNTLLLKEGSSVLCQKTGSVDSKFRILKVNEDGVQLSAFVKGKLGSFERGKTFYEFKQEEDNILSYREVLHVPQSWLHQEDELKVMDVTVNPLPMNMGYYYHSIVKKCDIAGSKLAPNKNERIFVQNVSQGYRFLKRNTVLLYKVEDKEIKEDDHQF